MSIGRALAAPLDPEPDMSELRAAMPQREELLLLWEFVQSIGKDRDAEDYICEFLWRHA